MTVLAPVNELLQEMADSLDTLALLQQRELNAIVDRQHADVNAITEAKEKALARVNQLDQQLAEHPDKEQLKDDPNLAEAVAAIKSTLSNVQHQSQVNEQVVQSTLNSIDQLKQTILQSARKDSLTYDSKGKIR
ncbi:MULTISPECIES: flagellar export chaperone FlgN [Idiomarina]|jgi:flagella synthesis protein FlgN|uniref:Flagellar export chaperone FlgN n=3 Tax=Idiomarina TaxID=135575 RepID=A0A8I1G3F2_9GAMM|nr:MULTISPECIES: flagellar export chaperone FlgN [Idiomarina]RDX35139.1 flagellar biosynthesis protein FlgN [Idiomarina sp. HD9-110m-PIT-SAG05]MAB22594.1 flagellar biosynthesis protein FlgN [Idiomarina sp.]MAO67472.1 flagellar biosynthesis protein FlgN [Idiomarina sp.]MBE92979.1 flagellar biosynthesis protein FlgN [Idiomarina sp.]MBF80346.1 flagellar biosynthesis protein FlgN [Idiomarina sp.]|tara:strand:+ start:163 stop:564 length:402 start_codon:yes stop_codon:yes gene_type:complete